MKRKEPSDQRVKRERRKWEVAFLKPKANNRQQKQSGPRSKTRPINKERTQYNDPGPGLLVEKLRSNRPRLKKRRKSIT